MLVGIAILTWACCSQSVVMCSARLHQAISPGNSSIRGMQVQPPGMHILFPPTKDDIREPEADREFRGKTWQTATEAQARLRPARLPRAPVIVSDLKLHTLLAWTFAGFAWTVAGDSTHWE